MQLALSMNGIMESQTEQIINEPCINWAILSSIVILPRRSLTRSSTGALASLYSGVEAACPVDKAETSCKSSKLLERKVPTILVRRRIDSNRQFRNYNGEFSPQRAMQGTETQPEKEKDN